MTDVLIRDVPDDVVAALDAHAGRLGLSRSEYVRRRLAQDAAMPGSPVTVQDLARFADVFGDLADSEIMARLGGDIVADRQVRPCPAVREPGRR
ncbi:MAG TPA: ribbon-helix-helix protein, CopG family [Streptosporangiaceae bacterium]|nr:ribbon-helix-helix protein, CopG family [Streptosporangiaceae bacterium]